MNNSKDKILYAIAFNKLVKTKTGKLKWLPGKIEYVHAKDELEARATFKRSYPITRLDIIAVAPAVGYYVEDKKGEVLSVS